jgi:hypothetical protein
LKPTINVMLDLETLGTKEYSAIISIGATWFDPTKIGPDAILAEYHVTIDPESATKKGLRMDASTVMWWMDPAQRTALDEWRNTIHFELDVALDGFQQFVLECLKAQEALDPEDGRRDTYEPFKQVIMWGNGPQFDCMLLRQAFEVCQRDVPWMHYNERCFRTMKSLPGAKSLAPPHEGTQHNALIDARQQTLWLCNILRHIPSMGEANIGVPQAPPQPTT